MARIRKNPERVNTDNPELIDDENPELTKEWFKRAKPASEVLPKAFLRRAKGAQKAPTKERITIRLSRDVVERFRDSGAGWQGRVDDALWAWLKRHSPSA